MLDLSMLNEAQREAVECTEGPLLVLAGAGSGKTRVLTYRIAHLIEDCGVSPWNILAVTFTNKAAAEMRERLAGLLPYGTRGMWISTFHSMCVRILRADAERLGYSRNFSIYDADDSKRLVKQVMTDLGISTKAVSANVVRSRISTAKNELVGPGEYHPRLADPTDKATKRVYGFYDERLRRADAMDFDDLLFNGYRLLSENTELARTYGERFCYILVDEYQDTNRAQYELCKMLAAACGNLMVVGDDDQSIYSWRGADIRNILEFEHDWPEAKTVKLEQNYRSTQNILDAANAVIAHNGSRKQKRLFTNAGAGEKIAVYLAADERDEGRWIASQAEQLFEKGASFDGIAVFYRTNAQSRTLEDMFLRAGVPYRIAGGTRFFDRAEIRDVMSYLHLAVNRADDVAARRVINVPRRGIGKTTVERIAHTANLRDISFFDAAREEASDPATRTSTRKALQGFVDLVEEISSYAGDLRDVVEMIVEKSGLVQALKAQRTDEADGRIENIREFQGVVTDFVDAHPFVPDAGGGGGGVGEDGAAGEGPDAGGEPGDPAEPPAGFHVPTMADFVEWLALRSDLDSLAEDDGGRVTFMTVHSAKGLEYDNVFVAGLEESIFPHASSLLENKIEEERRLAYVAITRARKRLFLTHASKRRIFNQPQANARSRFIGEIPSELVSSEGVGSLGMRGTGWEKRGDRRGTFGSGRGEEMYGGRIFGKGGSNAQGPSEDEIAARELVVFEVGDRVDHKTFGPGEVLAVEGDKLTIRFDKTGKTKRLLKGFAPIVKCG